MPGKIASGCFWAISARDGKASGRATANAAQNPIISQGQRTTKSAIRRISTLSPAGAVGDTRRRHPPTPQPSRAIFHAIFQEPSN
ncbi:hypothetical protein MAHJHV58_01520 [Mycobacterium avium subsp. hominissuis]